MSNNNLKVWIGVVTALLPLASGAPVFAAAKTLNDYCVTPPFIAQQIPPQVLINLGKDHKLYFPAYNDSSDIAGASGEDALDGILETGYNHQIDYYGYFDSYKCYNYSSGVFVPFGTNTDKYCTAGNASKWSGNFLNWVAMSRADIVKLVLYGGFRTSDNNGTNYAEISGENIPADAHSWGKEYLGADATKLFPVGVNSKRALFCVTGATVNGNDIAQLKVIPDATAISGVTVPLRAWSWVTVDGTNNICQDNAIDTNNDGTANTVTLTGLTKYNVSVRVCQPDAGFMGNDWEMKHCKSYGTNARPVGLMQIYGEAGGGTKVCSKDLYTSCTANTTCSSASPSKGECVDKTQMYFGLMMGSYKNPQAGGYLRKNIWSILNETNANNGTLQTSDPDNKGLIMKSIEGLKCPTSYPLSSHWGNPIGELLYESMRFWAGLGTPTAAFVSNISAGANGDNNYYASKPAWERPGNLFPSCSVPFNLLFSDSYNSFDDDQLPGSPFGTGSGNSGASELTNLNVQTLANQIATNEGLSSGAAMIGQAGTGTGVADSGTCTSKTITGLGNVRGLCPAEGDLRGTYYPAAVALYGHTQLKANHSVPNVNTFVISFDSIMPELPIYAGGKKATIVPFGKSNNGCSDVASYFPNTGYDPNTSTTPSRGLVLTPTGAASTCNTLQTTSFYILGNPTDDKINPTDPESPHYDASGNLTFLKFRWASDDNGGSDFDLDMLEEYTICSGSNNVACKDYNGNTLTLTSTQVAVTVKGVKSAAGNDAALGFIISGTGTTDGAYLPVKKKDSGGGANGTWTKIPESRTMVFTVSGNGGKLLKDPLWYTAKYGAFNDMDGDGLPFTDTTCDPDTRGASARNPKCNEWDTVGDGNPDNYFLISNPRQVENQLRNALNAILSRTASGTAASILSNSQGSGANILQALFYPKKLYANGTQVSWTGEMQNLWYFVDPFIKDSAIREDTDYTTADPLPTPNPAHNLDRSVDKKIQFFFDTDNNQTKARRFNSDGTYEEVYPDDPEKGVMSLWNAGKLLWRRDATTRTLYTTTDGAALLAFDPENATTVSNLKSYLQAAGSGATQLADSKRIMQYTLGTDVCLDTSSPCTNVSRTRTASINLRGGTNETHVWKLGDIVSSTPRIQGNQALGMYDQVPPTGYRDTTYSTFVTSANYGNRGMVYVGSNDGLLHAFKFGKLQVSGNSASLSGEGLGVEQWAFIPRHTLPYLKYLMDPTYKDNHMYLVDGSTSLLDVSTAGSTASYWNEARSSASWKTLLIGSTGIGGASSINSSSCADGSTLGTCVKTPILDPANSALGLGYSSYFALDVTNQDFNADATNALRAQPTLKWEFSDPALGYAVSGPAVVRINAKVKSGSQYAHDPSKNGRWLAVFASGPTGPIDTATHRFMGTSSQNLKLFVVDIEKGPSAKWVIDTGIANAFAGNISGSVIDTERLSMTEGYYQDDALYVGYTKMASDGTWTEGGVLRVVIPHDNDPDNLDLANSITPASASTSSFDPARHWVLSKLAEGVGSNNVGPVTTAVAKLQGSDLYLFFGSGRYSYAQDDMTSQRRLYMVQDNCYKAIVTHPDTTKKTPFDIDDNASSTCKATLGLSDLTNRTDGSNPANDTAVANGWYINLGTGERVVTDTVATVNGAVYFTSFIPTGDICSFGGNTYFWGVKYNTGFKLPDNSKQGKVLIQVSTGSFEQVDIGSALTANDGRRTAYALTGKASMDAPPVISKAGLSPVKRILHIQERQK